MRSTAPTGLVESTRNAGRRSARPAFTLAELLVVIGIILLLLGMVIGISTWAVSDARSRDTRSLLTLLDTAIGEFKEDTRGTLGRMKPFVDRYGGYPPDELEAYGEDGIPGSAPVKRIGGGTELNPVGVITVPEAPNNNINDMAAMVLAIRLYSEKGAQTLERIDGRFRRTIDTGVGYWDRDGDSSFTVMDEPFEYFVDAWEMPLEYFSIAASASPDYAASDVTPSAGARFAISQELTKVNQGRPVFASYGPDGKDQLSGTLVEAEDLIADWADNQIINNRFNHDNVYSTATVEEELKGP